ncbi:MAG: hypothetical protein K2W95_11260 [Candidatus Obscuribacterales bacterium]|nr:hypothetical protein [Candidatus Obscuribacterales bacterium]
MMYVLQKLTKFAGVALAAGHKAYTFLLPSGYQCFQLTERSRKRLLEKFPPKFSEVRANHITHDYGVSVTGELPAVPEQIEVIGYASDGSLECLVVRVDGQLYRPDGNPYHITLSNEPHRQAKESNELLEKGWQKIGAFFIAGEPQFRLIRKKRES